MSDKPKVVVNGEEVPPGKKVRLRDVGIDCDEIVRKVREEAERKKIAIEQAEQKEGES